MHNSVALVVLFLHGVDQLQKKPDLHFPVCRLRPLQHKGHPLLFQPRKFAVQEGRLFTLWISKRIQPLGKPPLLPLISFDHGVEPFQVAVPERSLRPEHLIPQPRQFIESHHHGCLHFPLVCIPAVTFGFDFLGHGLLFVGPLPAAPVCEHRVGIRIPLKLPSTFPADEPPGQGILGPVPEFSRIVFQHRAALQLALHLVEYFLRDDRLVRIFHEVLWELALVLCQLVAQHIDHVVFLQKQVAAVFFIPKDAVDGALVPGRLPRR